MEKAFPEFVGCHMMNELAVSECSAVGVIPSDCEALSCLIWKCLHSFANFVEEKRGSVVSTAKFDGRFKADI